MKTEIPVICPKNRQEWREWLLQNQEKMQSVWLIYFKKRSAITSISYNDAVDEAICFGWIDSKAKPIDEERYMQFFSRRKPKSVWSRVNKEKVERLIAGGLMTDAGFSVIDRAKQNGSWTVLDEAEALVIPEDLEEELQERPEAKVYFLSLSRSDKRNMLQWLVLAKRAETRQKRIMEIVTLAGQKEKPKQFR